MIEFYDDHFNFQGTNVKIGMLVSPYWPPLPYKLADIIGTNGVIRLFTSVTPYRDILFVTLSDL